MQFSEWEYCSKVSLRSFLLAARPELAPLGHLQLARKQKWLARYTPGKRL